LGIIQQDKVSATKLFLPLSVNVVTFTLSHSFFKKKGKCARKPHGHERALKEEEGKYEY